MKNKLSIEYAEALLELSLEADECNEYYEELKMLEAIFKSEREYIELLSAPSISIKEKTDTISKALNGRINDNIVSFLKLLCKTRRAGLFFECVNAFEKLYNESKRTALVRVTSATVLSDDEREKLRIALEKRYSLKVELSYKVDKGILGGIIIEAENAVLDGSLKAKLRDIKEVMRA